MTSSLKNVPVTPDKAWKYVGKTAPVPLEDVPILVKEMRESFFTHKYSSAVSNDLQDVGH